MVIEMYTGTTAYEEELKQDAKEEGRIEGKKEAEESARTRLIGAIKVLVSEENLPLSKAAKVFGLNETETRQLADELGDVNYEP
jgi:predicted transposase YdaD